MPRKTSTEELLNPTTTQDQKTMAKPKQPRRELKPKAEKTTQATSVEVIPKVQQVGRGKRGKAAEKPQDAPGATNGKKTDESLPAVHEPTQGILEALTDDEAILRDQLEYEVEQGIEGAFKVAGALLQIREGRLYRSTHGTYEDYVEDKWQMSSRRARHLTFAAGVVKSLEDAGVTELPTNERQVRELASVVPEDRQKVWTKAQEVAKKKGKKEPGRKDVKEAASKVGRPKGSKNSKQTPEQKKVQKAVDNGAIAQGTTVETTFVDEGVEAALVADIDKPDAEWLEQFPIRHELNEYCRTLFDEEALFYRWFSPHRKPLVRDVTSKLAAQVRKVAKRVGPYITRIEKALSLADPRTWVVCRSCSGTGHIEEHGACSDCKTAGYRLG